MDFTRRNAQRFRREAAYLKQRWRAVIDNDPCYNPNLTIAAEDFGLAFPPRAPFRWRDRQGSTP
jgi:O-antigen biosynthesis protein